MMVARVSLSILVTVFSPLMASVQAAPCTPPVVEKDSPYKYIVSLTDALSYAKSGLERIPASSSQPRPTDFDFLLGLKLGRADYKCAESQVSPYAVSSNEVIKTSAEGAAIVFSNLADLSDKSVAEYAAF